MRRHEKAHDETLDHIADAVAIFSSAKRLAFHNRAFAALWGLEPAWLEEPIPPEMAEVVIHASLTFGDNLLMASDDPMTANFGPVQGMKVAYSVGDAGEAMW